MQAWGGTEDGVLVEGDVRLDVKLRQVRGMSNLEMLF